MVFRRFRGSVSTFPFFVYVCSAFCFFIFFVAVAFFMCFTLSVSTDGVFY